MKNVLLSIPVAVVFAACTDDPPPISVSEFMDNPRLLEATMIRCNENRSQMKYETECVNARDAVNRLEARQERLRREELERQSELKRQALRRTQEAAAAARQRALEEEERRKEAEYLGLFEEVGSEAGGHAEDGAQAGTGQAVTPEGEVTDEDTGTNPPGELY